MPKHKAGQYVKCLYCPTMIYKKPSDDKFRKRVTCGSHECRSIHKTGQNNHFWGRKHSPETIAKLKDAHKGQRPKHSTKGYKHTPEARAKMSAALRTRWLEKRDTVMANRPRGVNHHWKKEAETLRHRNIFSPAKRRMWKGISCAWCGSDDRLNLDHILPVAAGGKNNRENAQTLCRTCNLWKMWYVDRPLTISVKATNGAGS